jgi:Flp pilus assembly protein CpaB
LAIASALPIARPTGAPRRGLFIVGLLMALLAFASVFVIGLVLAARATTATKEVVIVVAARDIGAREQITPDAVTLAHYPATQMPAGAFSSIAATKGQAAQANILKGQPVTSNLLSSASEPLDGTVGGYLPIPKGFVAVTLPTGEQQGVAGYIATGDYINVLATVSTGAFGQNPPRVVTRTVFTNLHVIRVGPAPTAANQAEPQKQGISSSITVVATDCDAQFLSWLTSNASLKYVLLSYKDYSPAPLQADPGCPATTAPAGIGPGQVDARYGFTRI